MRPTFTLITKLKLNLVTIKHALQLIHLTQKPLQKQIRSVEGFMFLIRYQIINEYGSCKYSTNVSKKRAAGAPSII